MSNQPSGSQLKTVDSLPVAGLMLTEVMLGAAVAYMQSITILIDLPPDFATKAILTAARRAARSRQRCRTWPFPSAASLTLSLSLL